MPKTYSEIEAEAVEAVRLARFRGTSPETQPACDLHAQLRCPKRHGTTCTDEKPCINKGAPA